MTDHLVLRIRLHDRRYHGASEWPPSPARVFQALLAGAALGNHVPEESVRALDWLEQQAPPVVAAPRARQGQRIVSFVPNNDADSLGGDLSRIEKIRSQKVIAPWLLESEEPFVYAWPLREPTPHADGLGLTVERLYQFGRGVDMAWARVEIMSSQACAELLTSYRGTVHRPARGGGGEALACPTPGSLQSLMVRHQAALQRLRTEGEGRTARCVFVQPPKPHFVQVSYDSPPSTRVFELVHAATEKPFAWRLRDVVILVESVRDVAAHRLQKALPNRDNDIRGSLIGKRPGEVDLVKTEHRVRIVPLPSIGHRHADRAIRRLAVEVPLGCPLSPDDVFWAFSGDVFDASTGEVSPIMVVPARDDTMLSHYALSSRRFRSVTPVALPARRRRIDPLRKLEEPKPPRERLEEEKRAVAAVGNALRHAGVRVSPVAISVQREPFDERGSRAEWFAPGTRFEKERLWHVALEFSEPVAGPLTLGDGRFLGLGVLRPQKVREGVCAFVIERGLAANADPVELARALRRAVMARVQVALGRAALPTFFSGHEVNGEVARRESEAHLMFHSDSRDHLFVIAPHLASRRGATREEQRHWALLERSMWGFCELRAGRAGILSMAQAPASLEGCAILAESRRWVSLTPYVLERHPKKRLPSQAMAAEIATRCKAMGLPSPRVDVRQITGAAGRGIEGYVHLTFPVAVRGPLVLGRTRYLGGGLFTASGTP